MKEKYEGKENTMKEKDDFSLSLHDETHKLTKQYGKSRLHMGNDIHVYPAHIFG